MKEFNLGDRVVNIYSRFKGTIVTKRTIKAYNMIITNYDILIDNCDFKLIECSPDSYAKI